MGNRLSKHTLNARLGHVVATEGHITYRVRVIWDSKSYHTPCYRIGKDGDTMEYLKAVAMENMVQGVIQRW